MNFSAWSIRNPVAPLLLFVLLVVLGVQSFYALPITRFPNVDVPVVSVAVVEPGAAPAEMEKQVTREVEDAVAGIAGVKHITSSVTDGVSTTSVEFRMEVPADQALQNVRDQVDKIRGDLPADVGEPIVAKVDVVGQPVETFAVASPKMSIEELSWFVDDTISRALHGQKGIGRIERYGGADREIRVILNPDALKAHGITASEVNQQIKASNSDLGGGRGEIGGKEQTIRTLGDAGSAAALAKMTIALPKGQFVSLGALGRVIDTHEEPRSFSRYDGKQVVSFAVFRAKGASEVDVAKTVNAELATIRSDNPDVSISKVDDTVHYTYGNYQAALDTLLEGAILAVLVVLLFLKNWRATLISALALPLSAIPTFWVMDLLGFSLNLVSFLAITLATGILVDDAIVEIENIARHIRLGKSPYRAAIDAADEIGLAVIATTSTIIAVFAPVSFMGGIPGQFFRQFGLTVAIAVFFSLVVARLITPMIAAYLMRRSDAEEKHPGDGRIMRGYVGLIRRTLKWRFTTLAAAIAVLAVSLFFMFRSPGSFIPPDDVSRISVGVELPPGSTLADTDAAAEKVRDIAARVKGVEHVFVLGGSSPHGAVDVRRGSVTVLLTPKEESLYKTAVNELVDAVP
ncbi:MAG: efflux RND transporter permease subunit, partial [Pararhizobium sp.]